MTTVEYNFGSITHGRIKYRKYDFKSIRGQNVFVDSIKFTVFRITYLSMQCFIRYLSLINILICGKLNNDDLVFNKY